MRKENNQLHKIALIDKDDEMFAILDDQKEEFHDFSWTHIKSVHEMMRIIIKEKFDLFLINETIIKNSYSNSSTFQTIFYELTPALFVISNNNRRFELLTNNSPSYKIINKPFRLNYLFDLINDILISNKNKKLNNITFDQFVLNPSEKTLSFKKHNKICFTETEFKIFIKLFEYSGKFVKKDYFLKKIWGIEEITSTHTFETHIYRIRKKISSNFGEKLTILSKSGKYSLKFN